METTIRWEQERKLQFTMAEKWIRAVHFQLYQDGSGSAARVPKKTDREWFTPTPKGSQEKPSSCLQCFVCTSTSISTNNKGHRLSPLGSTGAPPQSWAQNRAAGKSLLSRACGPVAAVQSSTPPGTQGLIMLLQPSLTPLYSFLHGRLCSIFTFNFPLSWCLGNSNPMCVCQRRGYFIRLIFGCQKSSGSLG